MFEKLLVQSNYDPEETQFMIQGFRQGFNIQYNEPKNRQSRSKNIPFTVGNKVELWNKLMKEVQNKRVAGPYKQVPFDNFIQSPIGLVPKAGGFQTRLIFHLSYEFPNGEKSVNACTPKELCSVTYNDINYAVWNFLVIRETSNEDDKDGGMVFLSKGDIKSAFRVLPLSRESWPWLIMSKEDPTTGEWVFFIDECLPFGSSISCLHFQRVSNALKHVIEFQIKSPLTNYLDDVLLYYALTQMRCNWMLNQFLEVCVEIGFPITIEKTEAAAELMIFLGILLDGCNFVLCVPLENVTEQFIS